MTEKEWLELKEKDLVMNPQALRPDVGPAIAEKTIHVVLRKTESLLYTQTVDIAQIKSVFMKPHALHLLQKHEITRA